MRLERMRLRQRGQSLVLMCLTMMFVVMMVMMSIGISTRVKEKMEAQLIADAASYSTAVATSRTLNTIALVNRVHVATMAAMTANQSLMSWAAMYRGGLNELEDMLDTAKTIADATVFPPPVAALCRTGSTLIQTAQQSLNVQKNITEAAWMATDAAAALLTKRMQRGYKDQQIVTLDRLRENLVDNQGLANEFIRVATEGDPHSEWAAAETGDLISNRERSASNPYFGSGNSYFHVPRRQSREIAVEIAHGSRGHEWVRTRDHNKGLLAGRLSLAAMGGVILSDEIGEGWFGNEKSTSETGYREKYGTSPAAANGADNATMRMPVHPGSICPTVAVYLAAASANLYGTLYSDFFENNRATHEWNGGSDNSGLSTLHRLWPCAANCPGMWTGFIDLNYTLMEESRRWRGLYGQPKALVAIERNFGARQGNPNPWEMRFTMDFATSSPQEFDNRGVRLTDGTDMRLQYAVSTAISYYHRPDGHWAEPPNFFNPFWRATLVSPAVDNRTHPNPGAAATGVFGSARPSSTDRELQELLNGLPSGQGSTAAELVNELARRGYLGWQ